MQNPWDSYRTKETLGETCQEQGIWPWIGNNGYCPDCAAGCDEITIHDNGSADSTVDYCCNCGKKNTDDSWNGFKEEDQQDAESILTEMMDYYSNRAAKLRESKRHGSSHVESIKENVLRDAIRMLQMGRFVDPIAEEDPLDRTGIDD